MPFILRYKPYGEPRNPSSNMPTNSGGIELVLISSNPKTTLSFRGMSQLSRITIDPAIAFGKPCIRGLRYSVEWLLELLSSGMTNQEILEDYEDLEQEDILAALAFAARFTQVKRMLPIAA